MCTSTTSDSARPSGDCIGGACQHYQSSTLLINLNNLTNQISSRWIHSNTRKYNCQELWNASTIMGSGFDFILDDDPLLVPSLHNCLEKASILKK
mmetsp:Transcript_7262/g.14905  ORF Transcript_7262/g.14905 Transcript_7262/m.14905 type:complete len:95 (-) Transcript_7262:726-1010(-)